MLGADLLVAPVVERGVTSRTVYLPAGATAWFDFHTGQRFAAGRVHTVEALWSTLPLFARDGASIALAGTDAARQRHDDPVHDIRIFRA